MTIKYHSDMAQRSPEWYQARCGLLTASEMKMIITPAKLQYAQNDKEKTHLYELAAQRTNQYVEPHFQTFDMLRGIDDELDAKRYYEENYAPVKDCGFITNDKWGFTLGYSPDGLVGEDGQIEAKGRVQKYQMETIVTNKMPDDFLIQVQAGLAVSERKYCDFISFCGGMHMLVLRAHPDQKVIDAILAAAATFHEKLENMLKIYGERIAAPDARLVMTERRLPDDDIKGSKA